MGRGGGGSWLGMGLNVYYIIYYLHHGTGDVTQIGFEQISRVRVPDPSNMDFS